MMISYLTCGKGKITVHSCPVHQRTKELAQRFPGLYLVYESLLFRTFSSFTGNHEAGFWDYKILSNYGFYLSFKVNDQFTLTVPGKDPIADMSSDAASIVANIYVLRQLQAEHKIAYLPELQQSLIDYALQHTERWKISKLTDI